MTAPGTYPAHREARERTLDGREVYLRPIRPDDAPRLVALVERLSPESIYFRFFHAVRGQSLEEARRLATVDYQRAYAIVASVPAESDELVGVGRYYRLDGAEAELALTVEDRWQGHGIGVMLFRHVAAHARAQGIATLRAEVMLDNARARNLFDFLDHIISREIQDGSLVLKIDISAAPAVDP